MKPAELIKKLKAGDGPDRELDWSINAAYNFDNPFPFATPPYTWSIDACVDLIAKVLPGFGYLIDVARQRDGKTCSAAIYQDRKTISHVKLSGDGTSRVCRALLCCIIEAKEAVDAYEKERNAP